MRVAESRSRRVSGLLQLLHSTYLHRRPHSYIPHALSASSEDGLLKAGQLLQL